MAVATGNNTGFDYRKHRIATAKPKPKPKPKPPVQIRDRPTTAQDIYDIPDVPPVVRQEPKPIQDVVEPTEDTTTTAPPATPAVVESEETAIDWETMPDVQPAIDLATQQAAIAKDQARKTGDDYMWQLKSLLYVPAGETETYEYLYDYDDIGNPLYKSVVREVYSDDLVEIERPDFGEYGPASDPTDDEEYRGPLGGLYDAIQRMQAGPDTASAFSHAATLLGFADRPATDTDPAQSAEEQYRSWIEEGRNTALEDMTGLGDEERDRMERLIYSGYTADRDKANRQVENMYSQTGSYMRALQSADESAAEIRDSRLKGEVLLMNQDFERKLTQFEQKKDQFFPMFQEGRASAEDFLANASRMMELEVVSYTQAVKMMQMEYENEVDALQSSIDNITKAAVLSIGFDEHAYNTWVSEYATNVQPVLDQFQTWLSEQQLNLGLAAAEGANESSDAENVAAVGSLFMGLAAVLKIGLWAIGVPN
jgi:hypothetical protein